MKGKQKQSYAKMPRTTIHLICGSHAVLTGKQSDRMSNSTSQPQVLEEEKKEGKGKQVGLVIAPWSEACWDPEDPKKAASNFL